MNYSECEKNNMPLLGLCPIGKFVFSHEDAIKQKKGVQNKLEEMNVPFIDIDTVIEDGIIRTDEDIKKAIVYFLEKKIDALFMPHCNFGTEHAVGKIAKALNVPVLIWGPRDEAPLEDGTRLRDTLCGLFASTKVLHKLNIPYTYIENCRTHEPVLEEKMDTFLRAVNISRKFKKGIKIGKVGQRIDFFWTTIINESELLEQFNVEVLPIDMVFVLEKAKKRAQTEYEKYSEEVEAMRKLYTIKGFDDNYDPIINILAARDVLLDTIEEKELDGIALQSFSSIGQALGCTTCVLMSSINEQFPVAAETDINGLISNIMLEKASFSTQIAYLTEFTVRHPENDNAVLLWHGGAPVSLAHPDEKMEISEHWIIKEGIPGTLHFRMKDGPITTARFDGDHGKYLLAGGEGHSIDGPVTRNNYVWFQVDNWNKWEKTLMNGPFIHHTAMSYGNYSAALKESCKYINGLDFVPLNEIS